MADIGNGNYRLDAVPQGPQATDDTQRLVLHSASTILSNRTVTGTDTGTAGSELLESLELFQQPPEAVDLVDNLVGTQRVPPGCGVDRDHRFSEPPLGVSRQADHRKIGPDLQNGIDVGAIELRQDSPSETPAPRQSRSMMGTADKRRVRP